MRILTQQLEPEERKQLEQVLDMERTQQPDQEVEAAYTEENHRTHIEEPEEVLDMWEP